MENVGIRYGGCGVRDCDTCEPSMSEVHTGAGHICPTCGGLCLFDYLGLSALA